MHNSLPTGAKLALLWIFFLAIIVKSKIIGGLEGITSLKIIKIYSLGPPPFCLCCLIRMEIINRLVGIVGGLVLQSNIEYKLSEGHSLA